MSAANSAIQWRARPVLFALALVAAAGIAGGWFMRPASARSFAYVYALLEPASMAVLCIGALHRQAKQAPWLVPLLLVSVMVNVTIRPHVPALTVLGLAAGIVAILYSICGYNRCAMAATLVCCGALSATLFAGLLDRGG